MARSASKAREGRRIKHTRNPEDTFEEASNLSSRFHGREPRDIYDILENEEYDSDLAVLGCLLELNIVKPNGKSYIPISFAPNKHGEYTKESVENGLGVFVCSDPKGTNIYFKDGNQELDLSKLYDKGLYQGEASFGKQYCIVGMVYSIVYWTDKHHLSGPATQKKGVAYEHQFGEEKDGEPPWLVYDTRNKKILLSGGSYEIRDEGIWN